MSKKILIMAGGTGGHIFPALSICNELKKRGANVEWLGGNNSMESELVPGYGIKFHGVYTSGIRGKKNNHTNQKYVSISLWSYPDNTCLYKIPAKYCNRNGRLYFRYWGLDCKNFLFTSIYS